MAFRDREQAGERLAERLQAWHGKDGVVLALPRGGVAVAVPVALGLKMPLDLLIVRKLGLPFMPEVAMGAIVDGDPPVIVRNEDVIAGANVAEHAFQAVVERERAELARRRHIYLEGRPMQPVGGRTVIIVDDGIATGATLRAALAGLRKKKPAEIIVAVPVAPAAFIHNHGHEADTFVCLEDLGSEGAISLHYRSFPQLDDKTVLDLMAEAGKGEKSEAPKGSDLL
jgi:predicted phosphoribosyltransferase